MTTPNAPRDPARLDQPLEGEDRLAPPPPPVDPLAGPEFDRFAAGPDAPEQSANGSTAAKDEAREKASAAKDEARQVGREGAETAKQVGQTAKEEAGKVAHEAKAHARNLVGELGTDLREQAGTQQQKVAEGIRALSDELRGMADNSAADGTASSLVDQAAHRAGDVAGWLESRDPGTLLEDVKDFARRKPGVFLAVAAGAGLVAGRLARGLAAESSAGSSEGTASTGAGAATGTATPPRTYEPAASYPPVADTFSHPDVANLEGGGVRRPEDIVAEAERGYPRA
ncbi:hypothetical protein ACX8Z9_13945 [Arthrobacter halodurans]|uniref:Uncharacterized protein n=1 Tax=Arthrobacter halodurans TaxID=516699 RepID=A0ABV4USF4_9MICC